MFMFMFMYPDTLIKCANNGAVFAFSHTKTLFSHHFPYNLGFGAFLGSLLFFWFVRSASVIIFVNFAICNFLAWKNGVWRNWNQLQSFLDR